MTSMKPFVPEPRKSREEIAYDATLYHTTDGALLGTPMYMAPEQCLGAGNVDHRADIYALGVVSFEMLAGRLPFLADNALDMMIAHETAPVPTMDDVRGIPIEVAQLIEAMLGKLPDERPTLAAVRAVLKRLVGTVIPKLSAAGVRLEDLGLMPTTPAPVIEALTRGDLPAHRASQPPAYELPRAPTHLSPADVQGLAPVPSAPPGRRWWVIVLVAATLIGAGLAVVTRF
jgi:serine/threonine-protein kinase